MDFIDLIIKGISRDQKIQKTKISIYMSAHIKVIQYISITKSKKFEESVVYFIKFVYIVI